MSKIITIFSNPGTYSSTLPSSAVSDKVEDNKTLTALGHTVDEKNFDKSRHVASLFNAISRGRNVHTTAQRIGLVSDHPGKGDNDIEYLSEAMKNIYGIHGDNAILGSIEVTDAQMEYLESNPDAMEVFIDNATIQPDNLSWNKEDVEHRESLCEEVHSFANDVNDLIDVAREAEDEDDDWTDDYDDYDEWNDDYDDWEEDDDDWFDESDFDVVKSHNEDRDVISQGNDIDIDDISPHAQFIILSNEDLERFKRDYPSAQAEQLEISFDDVDDE